MLEAKKIGKKYGQKKNLITKMTYTKAVSDITIKIPKGKVIGLLGINGSGKTTIINMLSGLIEPSEGAIFIDEEKTSQLGNTYKEKIGVISGSELGVYNNLTGKENLEYISALYGLKSSEQKNNIEKVLELVGLIESADTKVENYSLGMKQRLKIARGIVHNPEYILLDEPTIGLDIVIAKEIRKFIKKIKENTGVLLTTHYVAEVEELCDYIYVIDKGEIIYEGLPDDLSSIDSGMFLFRIVLHQKNEAFFDEVQKVDSIIESKMNETGKDYSFKSREIIDQEILKKIVKYNVGLKSYFNYEQSFEERLQNLLVNVKGR